MWSGLYESLSPVVAQVCCSRNLLEKSSRLGDHPRTILSPSASNFLLAGKRSHTILSGIKENVQRSNHRFKPQTSKSLQQFSVNVKYASETAHELLILLKFEGVFRRDPLQLARPVGMI